MSDPVKKVEIEDVLSSIRRLVTEDDRPEPAGARPAVSETDGRLVLTPALRVAETPEPEEVESSETTSVDEANETGDLPESDVPIAELLAEGAQEEELTDRTDFVEVDGEESGEALAEVGAETDDSHSEPEDHDASELSESAAIILTQQDDDMNAADDNGAVDDARDSDDPQDPAWKNGESFLFQAAQFVEKTDAVKRERLASAEHELHKAEEQSNDPNDSGADDFATSPEADIRSDEEETEHSNSELASSDAGTDEAEQDFASEQAVLHNEETHELASASFEFSSLREAKVDLNDGDTGQRAASLSAKIEALEAAIAETQDQWEPDGQGGDDYAGTEVEKIVWQDYDPQAAESADLADSHASVDPEPVEQPPAEDANEESSETLEEGVLDEDSLRDLVSDIVRQELQGALGERITRNVRKLVRREIHRALTTQELD